MMQRPLISKRTVPLVPYTTLFRSPWEQSQPVLDPRTADSGDFRVAVEESLEHFEGAHDFQIARKVVVSGEKQDLVASCLGGCVDRDIGAEHDLKANVRVIEQVADHHHDINVLRQLVLEIGKLVALALAAAVERDAVQI